MKHRAILYRNKHTSQPVVGLQKESPGMIPGSFSNISSKKSFIHCFSICTLLMSVYKQSTSQIEKKPQSLLYRNTYIYKKKNPRCYSLISPSSSSSSTPLMQRTLLHLIRTSPRCPDSAPSMYSSVFASFRQKERYQYSCTGGKSAACLLGEDPVTETPPHQQLTLDP